MRFIANENVLSAEENFLQQKLKTMDLRMEKRECICFIKNGGRDIDEERICASCVGD